MHQRRAAIGVAVIAASWGSIGVFVRWAVLPAVVIVWVRCMLATLTIGAGSTIHLGPRRAVVALRLPKPFVVIGMGVLLAVHWLFLVAAQQRASIGTVVLITYLAPVLVAALAGRVVGEHVPARTFAALAVALLGTLLLVRPTPGQGVGVALAVAAAVTYAAVTLLSKRVVGVVGGTRLAFVQLGVGGLVVMPLALRATWGQPSWSWAWLVLVGVVLTGVAGPLYLVLLGRLPVASVGVLSYLEPMSAVVLAWWLLGEVPTLTTLIGGTLIVGAGIMVIVASGTRVSERRLARAAR